MTTFTLPEECPTCKKATYDECEEFVRRMDIGRYGSRAGIWLALPTKEG